MGDHSKLSASGMYRWKACPGSVRECRGIKSPDNEWSIEGTRVHDLAAMVLNGDYDLDDHPNVEQRENVRIYVDTVMDDYLSRKTNPKNGKPDHFEHMWVEKKLSLEKIYPGTFGTSDAIVWDEEPRFLRVYDYKNGTDPVDPVENEQELYYALGAMVTLKLPVLELELVIVQPRVRRKKKISRWRTDIVRLMDFKEEFLDACRATQNPKAELRAGRHCYWCPAKPTCPEHKRMANAEAAAVFDDIPTVEDLF